jgi:hypothetical protein
MMTATFNGVNNFAKATTSIRGTIVELVYRPGKILTVTSSEEQIVDIFYSLFEIGRVIVL